MSVNKYLKNGELRLSAGFFPTLQEGKVEYPAIVQIVKYKHMEDKENAGEKRMFCARLAVSDGAFECNFCFFDASLESRVLQDEISKATQDSGPIIAVKKAMICTDKTLNGGRKPIVFTEYELLVAMHQKLGKPISYSDDPTKHEAYKRIEFPDISIQYGQQSIAPSNPPAAPRQAQLIPQPPTPSRIPSSAQAGVTPISAVTPYINRFRICGKVTTKEEMRTVNMKNGPAKVFNFELTDKDGSTIRIAAFGETAEKMNDIVRPHTMYYVSNAGVRPANKRFNSTGHDYELSLNNNSEVVLCNDDAMSVETPKLRIKAVPLNELTQHNSEMVDVLAVIESVSPANEFTSRAGNQFVKRDLTLIDPSLTSVTYSLWGEAATNFPQQEAEKHQVIAIKGASVREFNGGFSLSGGKYFLTPELEKTFEMLMWYENERPNQTAVTISAGGGSEGLLARDLRCAQSAVSLQLGRHEANGTYFTLKAVITNIKSDVALYTACSSEGCQKKVVQVDDTYRCDKCNTNSHRFKFCYMLQMEVTDLSGSIWLTLFGKTAEQLTKMPAEELGEIKNDNPERYEAIFDDLRFKYFIFRVRAKAEIYNDEERIRYSCVSVDRVNYDKLLPVLEDTDKKLEEFHI